MPAGIFIGMMFGIIRIKHTIMKLLIKCLVYSLVITAVIVVNSLFFLHHPPEVQLVFITPGVIILGYSIISDDFRKKTLARARWSRGR
jgi:hypothetical protein